MKGHKWNAFVYDLSFIGWFILSAFTCGLLGVFYVFPYKFNSDAALYQAIKRGWKKPFELWYATATLDMPKLFYSLLFSSWPVTKQFCNWIASWWAKLPLESLSYAAISVVLAADWIVTFILFVSWVGSSRTVFIGSLTTSWQLHDDNFIFDFCFTHKHWCVILLFVDFIKKIKILHVYASG